MAAMVWNGIPSMASRITSFHRLRKSRSDFAAGPSTRILYCTTGWLLRQLTAATQSAGTTNGRDADADADVPRLSALRGLSHVIVDEVRPAVQQSPI